MKDTDELVKACYGFRDKSERLERENARLQADKAILTDGLLAIKNERGWHNEQLEVAAYPLDFFIEQALKQGNSEKGLQEIIRFETDSIRQELDAAKKDNESLEARLKATQMLSNGAEPSTVLEAAVLALAQCEREVIDLKQPNTAKAAAIADIVRIAGICRTCTCVLCNDLYEAVKALRATELQAESGGVE